MIKKLITCSLFFFAATEVSAAPRDPNAPGCLPFGIAHQQKKNVSFFANLKTEATNLVQKNQGSWICFALILLLGLLMSFTPCIYPMIPITIGVLQSTGTTSLGRTTMLALCYTCGISLTFASLGLIAAHGGAQFGTLLTAPWFIVLLVLFFGYLAFSMLGFYDMYVPRFMQKDHGSKHNGSLISAFLFGALSGTIASPCVSPGLALLLGIAAQTQNHLLGFAYLFFFGLGLCIPLLLIGIFSKSLDFLPSAGTWMVEVKHFFGFLLLLTCFYYLSFILPAGMAWNSALFAIACLSGALFREGLRTKSRSLKYYRLIIGLIGLGAILFFAISTYYKSVPAPVVFEKPLTYEEARAKSQQEHKPLLLEFGAQYCTLCHQVEKYFKSNEMIKKALEQVVLVKIDGTDPKAEPAQTLLNKYTVMAYPTLILVHPTTGAELARWNSNIMEIAPTELEALLKTHQTQLQQEKA